MKGDPCLRCGKPSHDHHHARHEDLNQGKGMGGTSHDDSHFLMMDLCRGCHDRAHAKLTIFTVDDSAAATTIRWRDVDAGQALLPMGERPLHLSPDETDEALAVQWAEAQALGAQAIIKQAHIANEYRRRYGGFDHWWVRVAEIIRDVTGLRMSVGVVYDRAALGIALEAWDGDPEDFVHELGVKSLAAVGRAIDQGAEPEQVIEFALTAVAGTTRTNASKLIRREYLGTEPLEATPCLTHRCATCGAEFPTPNTAPN